MIELKCFEEFKEQIDYQTFRYKINEYKENMVIKFTSLESENKEVKLEKLQNTIFKYIKDLNDLLKNKHEFILINAELSKEIIKNEDKGEYFCFFSFNSSELILKIEEDSLHFHLNKNIINLNNLKDKEFYNNFGSNDNGESEAIDSDNLINKNMSEKNLEDNKNLMKLIN